MILLVCESLTFSFERLPLLLPLWWLLPILGKLIGDDGLDVGLDEELVLVEAGLRENWGSGSFCRSSRPPPKGDSFFGLDLDETSTPPLPLPFTPEWWWMVSSGSDLFVVVWLVVGLFILLLGLVVVFFLGFLNEI